MYKETEIKLPIEDLNEAIAKVQALNGQVIVPKHFEDNFLFDQSDGRLAKERMLLRMRLTASAETPHTEKQVIVTYKGKPETVDGVKQREEIECEITGATNLKEIFNRLGFQTTFRYQKYRTIYGVSNIELQICVDQTPIGDFFELEGEIIRIHEFATKLGYNRDDYITQSYASLYYRWCQKTGSQEPFMLF